MRVTSCPAWERRGSRRRRRRRPKYKNIKMNNKWEMKREVALHRSSGALPTWGALPKIRTRVRQETWSSGSVSVCQPVAVTTDFIAFVFAKATAQPQFYDASHCQNFILHITNNNKLCIFGSNLSFTVRINLNFEACRKFEVLLKDVKKKREKVRR